MAEVVLGIGTSHTPMMSLPHRLWRLRADAEKTGAVILVDPESGETVDYAELLRRRSGTRYRMEEQDHERQWEACQAAITELGRAIRQARPDVLVVISNDQDETLFDDNMPMFQIYWGDSFRAIPRFIPETATPDVKEWVWGYGDVEMDVPVDAGLGRHLVEYLTENEFDISHSRYMKDDHQYGGRIGPAGDVRKARLTKPRRQGFGHGWTFIVKRLLENQPIPMVPVIQNTCYPPNSPTPRRCYKLGEALRRGIEAWEEDKRVCVIASGGLSHFVTDEHVDRLLLKGIVERDAEILCNLPRQRLLSASSEIKNWITCAAACGSLKAKVIDYVPVYRSEAGTGGGWAFVTWK